MQTETLTAMLALNLEPVAPTRTARRYVLGITAGALVALVLVSGALHVNPALTHEAAQRAFWVREPYCAALGALSVLALARLARPGDRLGLWPAGIAVVVHDVDHWLPRPSVLSAASQSRVHLLARHDRERMSLPDRIPRSAAVCRIGMDPQRSRPDAATLGRRNRRIRGGFPRCAHLFPALSGARPAVYRHMVSAGYVDPHGYWGLARPAAPALVSPGTDEHNCLGHLRYRTMTWSAKRTVLCHPDVYSP